jgi:hypothetical protein
MIATLLMALAFGQSSDPKPEVGRSKTLLALHEADASQFAIFRDASRAETLSLRREPIYRWTNPTRSGGQEGDVFLWTYKGRPEAVGCIFSHPEEPDRRVICHELHSLSRATLIVDRDSKNRWEPKAAGVEPRPVPNAPAPATTAPARLRQMNAIAREFSGNSRDHGGKRWDFRLLPKPLYRYESTDPEVVDGAVFAFVTSAGTDPELLLVIDARKSGGQPPRWEYSAARFSDLDLWLRHKDAEVWAVPPARIQDGGEPSQRYRLYVDRKIPEVVRSATETP